MRQNTQPKLSFARIFNKKVEADFEGGNVTSDGGALFLREVEKRAGVISRLCSTIRDHRDARYVDHTIEDLISQRVYQIACGYEDANDSNTMRRDPGIKVACGKLPITGKHLSGQSTMTRLENGISHRDKQRISRQELYQMGKALVDTFIASYEEAPEQIILDIDDTDDPVHGQQEQTNFNSYYGEHCYLPLHIYEGQTGKLILALLRPGQRPSGKQIRSILKRLVPYLKAAWPDVKIFLRADSHFSAPEVHSFCNQSSVYFLLGQGSNSVLKAQVAPLVNQAKDLFALQEDKAQTIRLFTQFSYQADSWDMPLRVVAKVEVSEKGENIRFVVTNLQSSPPSFIYSVAYCDRGRMEGYIKNHKTFLHSDRTSCTDFHANHFRLFLHSAAYVLLHTLSEHGLQRVGWQPVQFNTIQNRILKVGARVQEWKTKIEFHFPTSFPLKRIFARLLYQITAAYS
jgi:hypothetical protein